MNAEKWKIIFDIVVAVLAIVGGLYAGVSWISDHFDSMQRLGRDDVVPNV
jgi:hypothetical protein